MMKSWVGYINVFGSVMVLAIFITTLLRILIEGAELNNILIWLGAFGTIVGLARPVNSFITNLQEKNSNKPTPVKKSPNILVITA